MHSVLFCGLLFFFLMFMEMFIVLYFFLEHAVCAESYQGNFQFLLKIYFVMVPYFFMVLLLIQSD